MKTIVLAAGYGTRLQSVIGDFPKPLVDVGGETVLDRLIRRIESIQHAGGSIQQTTDVIIVSNARYIDRFEHWRDTGGHAVTLLNDGSTNADNRRGAVGDIAFAIERTGIDNDLLVLAADNVLTFALSGLIETFLEHGSACVGVRFNADLEDNKRRGVVEIDDRGAIVSFIEKPERPVSHWAAAPLYVLPRSAIAFIHDYLARGGNTDAPGHLMAAYVEQGYSLRAWTLPGEIFDVGNPESLALARRKLS